jgi:hypothetical protein
MKPSAFVTCVALLIAGSTLPAFAACPPPQTGDPSPLDHDIPDQINLVGLAGGVPDARGEFTIVIRDLAHNPIVDCEVAIDFRDCWGIRLSTDQPWPGTTLSCELNEHGWPFAVMRGISDANGSVTFRIVGGSVNFGNNTAGNNFNCARVLVAGVNTGLTNVGAFDQNGQSGVGPVDIALWLEDAFDVEYEGRSDYNGSNTINPSDLSFLINVALGGGSSASASSYCQ